MGATAFFDALAREDSAAAPPAGRQERRRLLARFAEQLVAAQLEDLNRLSEYERQFALAPQRDAGRELEVRRSVWQLYADWADDAEGVLSRARSVTAETARTDALDRAIGSVRARLSVAPEQTASAIADARTGRVIPAKELRDELDARLRA